ncbi:MAG: hypothetical protein CL840_21470 [Crocinitomicaceae bacterium]|nr:hypothetical protein [Crocinitomicaceae bacterium]|tara:strand:+ start:13736 stop:14017 length:282 start_codon:yes stop_codon:yes gene_type:complete
MKLYRIALRLNLVYAILGIIISLNCWFGFFDLLKTRTLTDVFIPYTETIMVMGFTGSGIPAVIFTWVSIFLLIRMSIIGVYKMNNSKINSNNH